MNLTPEQQTRLDTLLKELWDRQDGRVPDNFNAVQRADYALDTLEELIAELGDQDLKEEQDDDFPFEDDDDLDDFDDGLDDLDDDLDDFDDGGF